MRSVTFVSTLLFLLVLLGATAVVGIVADGQLHGGFATLSYVLASVVSVGLLVFVGDAFVDTYERSNGR